MSETNGSARNTNSITLELQTVEIIRNGSNEIDGTFRKAFYF